MKYLLFPLWLGLLLLPLAGMLNAVKITAAAEGVSLLIWLVGAPRLWPMRRLPLQAAWEILLPWRLAIVAAIALLLPFFLNDYYIDVLAVALLYAILAVGLNIAVGFCGLLDLGYAAFYAIGAYTYALANRHLQIPFWLGLPVGGAAAALFGVLLGLVTLRLRGDYLAIVTLGFIQIVRLILNNWDSVTNGPNGILNIGRPTIGAFTFSLPTHFYYLMLAFLGLAVAAALRLYRSRVGRAWVAIREDELAASAVGIDTTRYKILAFAVGASFAGVAGVLFAGKFAFISPESFSFFESVLILAMVVLGGMGSVAGSVAGALLLIIIPELLRPVASFRMLIFGAILVAMMVFRPQGLLGRTR